MKDVFAILAAIVVLISCLIISAAVVLGAAEFVGWVFTGDWFHICDAFSRHRAF